MSIHTKNILKVYRAAVAAVARPGTWYADALATCQDMAVEHGVPVHVVAGVVAALSPRLGWGPNLKLAHRMLFSEGTLERGGLGANLRKAREIYAGADPLEVMTAPKTANFYRAILSAGLDGVVVDRHAYDIADGTRHTDKTRPSLTPLQYERVAERYRRAAAIATREQGRPVSPSEVQSVTWVAWRRKYWAEGAYDA